NQPETDAPSTPALASRSISRRDSCSCMGSPCVLCKNRSGLRLDVRPDFSANAHELSAVDQHPIDAVVALLRICMLRQIIGHLLDFLGSRAPRERGQEQLF